MSPQHTPPGQRLAVAVMANGTPRPPTVRLSNASEVARDGSRLLEQREQEDTAKIQWLRHLGSGDFVALFDRSAPYGLAPHLTGHAIVTADERGWARLENGELLST